MSLDIANECGASTGLIGSSRGFEAPVFEASGGSGAGGFAGLVSRLPLGPGPRAGSPRASAASGSLLASVIDTALVAFAGLGSHAAMLGLWQGWSVSQVVFTAGAALALGSVRAGAGRPAGGVARTIATTAVACIRTFGALGLVVMMAGAIVGARHLPASDAELFSQHSIPWLAAFLAGSVSLLVARRAFGTGGDAALPAVAAAAGRTVVIGAGPNGRRFCEYVRSHAPSQFRMIGVVDDRAERVSSQLLGLPMLGDVNALIAMVRRGLVDTVVVALPMTAVDRVAAIVTKLATVPVDVRLAPDLAAFQFPDAQVSLLGRLPLLKVSRRPISAPLRIAKRAEDLIVASLLLLVFGPLMAVIACAIRLDSPGPVLFRQTRYGLGGEPFKVLKFRTMRAHLGDEACVQQTVRGDARVTRVGGFLRRMSLDELPQIFNVFAGQMSVVGPRPHAVTMTLAGQLLEEVEPRYMERHHVKPGITGWAQVNGWRGETDTLEKLQKRVEHDLYYIGNWSLRLDAWILIATAMRIFADKNAY